MTEQTDAIKGKVVALDHGEFQALVMHNLARLNQFLGSLPEMTDAHLVAVNEYLNRTRALMGGWKHASAKAAADKAAAEAAGAAQPEAPAQAANGAVKPRKGGWPKGKPRKPAQPQASVQ